MSRHTFQNEATNSEIAVGWDPGLDTYFAVVLNNNSDVPTLWLGKTFHEIQHPQPVIDAATAHADQIDPETLSRQLIGDRNIAHFYDDAISIAPNQTICQSGCSHEDRIDTYEKSTLSVDGALEKVCGNCDGPLTPDHESHVLELQDHLQINPKAYKTPDTFAYDRDCLIEMSKAYNDAYPPVHYEHDALGVVRLNDDLDLHFAQAKLTNVYPHYLEGHQHLMHRLAELQEDMSYQQLVPAPEREQDDFQLEQYRRDVEAESHIATFGAKTEYALSDLQDIRDNIPPHGLRTHDDYLRNAEELSALGHNILHDSKTYEPHLEQLHGSWKEITHPLLHLDNALNKHSSFEYYADLYLEPIARSASPTNDEAQADTQYRDVRQTWHTHLNNAHLANIHPYVFPGADQIIQTMKGMQENLELTVNARHCVREQIGTYDGDLHSKARIDTFLDRATKMLHQHDSHNHTVAKLECLNVSLDDISTYGLLKTHTANLAHTGEQILKDEWNTFDHYLERSPDVERELRNKIDQLNTTIDRKQTDTKEEKQELSQQQTIDEHRSVRRTIKF